jgi:hypothetical protein
MSNSFRNKAFLSTPTEDQDTIAVHSAIKVWYYKKFKGFSVVRQSALPAPGLLGTLAYRRTWILKREEK